MLKKDPKCTWYSGNTLFEALDKTPLPPRNENDNFYLPVYDRYKSKNIIAYGKIEKGVIVEGTNVVVMPAEVKAVVASLFVDETKIRRGVPGDNIRMILTGVDADHIYSGSVICQFGKPCHVADKAIVKMKATKQAPALMTAGFSVTCHIHNEIVQCFLERILFSITPGNKTPDKSPRFLKPNQFCEAIVKFAKPICIESFSDFPQLARFLWRYEGYTIAFGVVKKLPKSKSNE